MATLTRRSPSSNEGGWRSRVILRFNCQTALRVCARIPAARFRPGSANSLSLSRKRAQGKPGANCTRSLVCESEKHTSVVTTGSARTTRLSPRNGFTACFVLSPVSGLFCHRRHPGLTERLDARVAAPGPHDFAVRCGRFARRAKARLTPQRPSQPAPTFRDDRANVPSW